MAKRLVRGENDLASQKTPILNQWDYEKNFPLTPEDVSYSSTKKVWWICSKGHSWDDSVESRYFSAGECPVCNNQRIISGINDLPTVNPKVMESWDYEKNTVNPHTLSERATKSVCWKCEKDHSWKTSVSARVKQDGCPYCRGRKIWPGFNDLKTLFPVLMIEWDFELNTVNPGTIASAEGKEKVSETGFVLRDDGGIISESCWKVTWYEDYVEIILSGKEQLDEQIILYFDGTKEMRHLTGVQDS